MVFIFVSSSVLSASCLALYDSCSVLISVCTDTGRVAMIVAISLFGPLLSHLRPSGGPMGSQNPPQNSLAFSAPIRSYYNFLGNNNLYSPSCRLENPDYLVYRSDNPHVKV